MTLEVQLSPAVQRPARLARHPVAGRRTTHPNEARLVKIPDLIGINLAPLSVSGCKMHPQHH